MAYNFLQGWVDARAVDISESSNEFLDVVAKQAGGWPGLHAGRQPPDGLIRSSRGERSPWR